MADNSVTITEAEFLEFRRLAVAYNLNRDDFDIREKYIPGNGAATRVEVVYGPNGVRREYERNQNSSWLGQFGEDLADHRFGAKSAKKLLKGSRPPRSAAAKVNGKSTREKSAR